MERSPYAPFTPSSDGPNPLRPYYRPPSIGGTPTPFEPRAPPVASNNTPSFGTSARSVLSDLSYGELLGDGVASTSDGIRALLDQAMWKYSSIFMAQPFEISKMVLQVRLAGQVASTLPSEVPTRKQGLVWQGLVADEDGEDGEEEEEDDEMSYFTSAAPHQDPLSPPRPSPSRSRGTPLMSRPRTPAHVQPPLYKLDLRRQNSLMEVLGQLWTKEGAWGVWKGTNVTFLHSLLLKTIETWLRGMFSAMLNLPDPGVVVSSSGVGGLDILDSPSPLSSLGIAVAAAGVAGLLLAPLDAVRTRVMLTSTTEPPRSIIPCLRSLPSWTCPTSLMVPTLLHSALPTFISTSTPLFLRANLRIDPIITPVSYSICTFLSSTAELFIKLPIETVLRRGQIDFISKPSLSKQISKQRASSNASRSRSSPHPSEALPVATVVDVGPYTGIVSTMWRIAREEGSSMEMTSSKAKGAPGTRTKQSAYAPRKGQGVQGLWRGWRVGLWGLVGVWGAAALGAGGEMKGGEF